MGRDTKGGGAQREHAGQFLLKISDFRAVSFTFVFQNSVSMAGEGRNGGDTWGDTWGGGTRRVTP